MSDQTESDDFATGDFDDDDLAEFDSDFNAGSFGTNPHPRAISQKTIETYLGYVNTIRKRYLRTSPDGHLRDVTPMDLVDHLIASVPTLRPKTFMNYRCGLLYWLGTMPDTPEVLRARLSLQVGMPKSGFKGPSRKSPQKTSTLYSSSSVRPRTFALRRFQQLTRELSARMREQPSETFDPLTGDPLSADSRALAAQVSEADYFQVSPESVLLSESEPDSGGGSQAGEPLAKNSAAKKRSRKTRGRSPRRAAELLFWLKAGLATGLRPVEWSDARWEDESKGRLLVRTAKIKHGTNALPSLSDLPPPEPFKERIVTVNPEDIVWVNQHLACVRRHLRSGEPFSKYYNNNRIYLWEVSRFLFGEDRPFTLYMMRGQFAANRKRSFPLDEVAESMGCAPSKASTYYGNRIHGHRSKSPIRDEQTNNQADKQHGEQGNSPASGSSLPARAPTPAGKGSFEFFKRKGAH